MYENDVSISHVSLSCHLQKFKHFKDVTDCRSKERDKSSIELDGFQNNPLLGQPYV